MSTMPPPRPTDDDVRRMPLHDAFDDLLAELRGDASAAAPVVRPPARRRPQWLVAVAAAAAVAALLVVPAVLHGRSEPGPDDRPAGRPAVERVPFVPPRTLLAVDLPGWSVAVDAVVSDADSVMVAYAEDGGGGAGISLVWTISSEYAERGVVTGQGRQLTVAGVGGNYDSYYGNSSVILPPDGPYYLTVQGYDLSGPDFRAAVAALRPVDTLPVPDEVVEPAEELAASINAFAGAELPDGFTPRQAIGWNSLGALYRDVTFQVDCAWLQAYAAADGQAEIDEVRAALERAEQWPLQQVDYAEPGRFDNTLNYIRRGGEQSDAVRGFCG